MVEAWQIAAVAALALVAIARAFDASGLGFREDGRYIPPDEARLFDPRAASIALEAAPAAEGRPPAGAGRAILFIHGFPESPAAYADAGALAAAAGFAVRCPLLPGCGTSPRDLRRSNYAQYLARARDEYLALRAGYAEVFVVGSSMGGLIALELAIEAGAGRYPRPEAMAVLCPPLYLNRLREGVLMHPLAWFARSLGVFVPALGAGYPDPAREGKDGDRRWVGYRGLYPRQTYSILRAGRRVERRLRGVEVPLQLLGCRTDRLAPFACVGTVARKVSSRDIRSYTANMDGQAHMRHSLLLYDSQRDRAWGIIRAFFGEYSALS